MIRGVDDFVVAPEFFASLASDMNLLAVRAEVGSSFIACVRCWDGLNSIVVGSLSVIIVDRFGRVDAVLDGIVHNRALDRFQGVHALGDHLGRQGDVLLVIRVDFFARLGERFGKILPGALKPVLGFLALALRLGVVVGQFLRRPEGALTGKLVRQEVQQVVRAGGQRARCCSEPASCR